MDWIMNVNHAGMVKGTGPEKAGVSRAQERLKEACKGFEALFINEMLKSMRRTIPKSGLLDGGVQGRIYESMFDEAVSRALSERGALGIADMLYREFKPHVVDQQGGGKK